MTWIHRCSLVRLVDLVVAFCCRHAFVVGGRISCSGFRVADAHRVLSQYSLLARHDLRVGSSPSGLLGVWICRRGLWTCCVGGLLSHLLVTRGSNEGEGLLAPIGAFACRLVCILV
jgi:hypothetical protein